MKHFSTGEMVVSYQGGPPMTVNHASEDDEIVRCVWFEDTNLKTAEFPANSLRRVIYFDVDDVPEKEAMEFIENYLKNQQNKKKMKLQMF